MAVCRPGRDAAPLRLLASVVRVAGMDGAMTADFLKWFTVGAVVMLFLFGWWWS